MESFHVEKIEVMGPKQLVIDDEVIDISELVREKQAALMANNRRLVTAKVRISSKEPVNPMDLAMYLSKFKHWFVRKITLNFLSPRRREEKHSHYGFNYVIDRSFSWSMRKNMQRFLRNRTLHDVLNFLGNFPMEPSGIDAVELMVLSNTKETVSIGCQGDCLLTFQGATEEQRYQEFIDFWQDKVELSVGLCGRIEEEEIEWRSHRVRTGKRKIGDWTCFL